MTGTITRLESGYLTGGFGHIASDAHELHGELGFHETEVATGGFARLRRGQRVRFDPAPLPGSPGHFHAIHVMPLAAKETDC
jgi:cold shock CspA family protein